jgi:site-specific DNA recombinase
MMRDAAAAFDALVVYDLDRFGRNGRKSMEALNTLADLRVSIWDFSTGQKVDLDSFEGETSAFLKTRVAQEFRTKIRQHTRHAMHQKAAQGFVAGGLVFGYDNVRIGKGQVTRAPNADADIVKEIDTRFAAGDGIRTIAATLNQRKVASPRAQQGRPNGWSASTIRAVLDRPLYRGEVVYGKTSKKYGRELPKGSTREKGQIENPESEWIRHSVEALRIIDADLSARVDAKRIEKKSRYLTALVSGGRVPERANGKYLLSGGMLVCPTCGGNFEAVLKPWGKSDAGIDVCATRRRKPGACTNTLTLPMTDTDDAVLEVVSDKILGPMTLTDLNDRSGFVDWEASITPDILEVMLRESPLVHEGQKVASPTGFEPVF